MNGGCAERIVAGWRNRRHDGGDMRFRMDAARAWVVDHMGNRTPQAIEGGTVRWPCTSRPSALVLEEATQVEAVAEDLVPPSLREAIAPGRDVAPTRAPDLVLDQPGQVVCAYDANPATTARTWKGPADCSLRAWFADEPDGFRIRAVVCLWFCYTGGAWRR